MPISIHLSNRHFRHIKRQTLPLPQTIGPFCRHSFEPLLHFSLSAFGQYVRKNDLHALQALAPFLLEPSVAIPQITQLLLIFTKKNFKLMTLECSVGIHVASSFQIRTKKTNATIDQIQCQL